MVGIRRVRIPPGLVQQLVHQHPTGRRLVVVVRVTAGALHPRIGDRSTQLRDLRLLAFRRPPQDGMVGRTRSARTVRADPRRAELRMHRHIIGVHRVALRRPHPDVEQFVEQQPGGGLLDVSAGMHRSVTDLAQDVELVEDRLVDDIVVPDEPEVAHKPEA